MGFLLGSIPIIIIQDFPDISMTFLWVCDGIPSGFLWDFHDGSTTFLWDYYWISIGVPRKFLRLSM